MVTKTGTVKCDGCGRFVADAEYSVVFMPDNSWSREQTWHFCPACK